MRLTQKVLYGCLVVVGVLALMVVPAVPVFSAPTATIRYVSPAGVATGACNTWGTACTLQYALTTAVAGDEVWVKAGMYTPTSGADRHATFQLKNGVAVYGGFAGTETVRDQRDPTANLTILSGDIGTLGNSADNVYHVVSADAVDPTTVLDGFTITGGNANDDTTACPSDACGGGVYLSNSAPALTAITLQTNVASESGGGLYVAHAPNGPVLTRVTFQHNTATNGGGLFVFYSTAVLTNSTFTQNTASDIGGGLVTADSTVTVTRVIFDHNTAISFGGAMNNENSSLALADVTFDANTVTDGSGGAIRNDFSSPTLERVTFSNNTVIGGDGGAMYNELSSTPVLTNVTFYNNSATMSGGFNGGDGGAIYNYVTTNAPRFLHVTFSNNHAVGYDAGHPAFGGAIYMAEGAAAFTNTLMWGNTPDQIYDDGSTTTFNTGIVQGGCPIGLSLLRHNLHH